MSDDTFRCLAVRQPWAWAIVSGAKDVENRSWKTDYRGSVVIQAGATKSVVNQFMRSSGSTLPSMAFAYGALIGVVDLVDIVPLSEALESNSWAWGPYCWKMANPRRFAEPIPAKGKLNLYTLPTTISPRIRAAMENAIGKQADATASAWIKATTEVEAADARVEGLFDSYLALADVPSLMRLAQCAIEQRGDSEAFVYRAIAKCVNEDNDEALADANQAIAIDPLNARAFVVRGNIYRALNKLDLAARDRTQAEALGASQPPLPSQDDESN